MIKISDRIECLQDTINSVCARADRNPDEIKLVVVTKSATIDAIKEVIHLGFTNLGENRVQQLKKVSAEIEGYLGQKNGDSGLLKKSGRFYP